MQCYASHGVALLLVGWFASVASAQIELKDDDDHIAIETALLKAEIRKTGYVSGIAKNSFTDKKTGAKDLGFGLHIMDFLLAPGWRDDGYVRGVLHGELAKHYVEGPQICTQAKRLKPEIIRGKDFLAVRMKYNFTQPGKGYKAGSTWEQTIVFFPDKRYILCGEQITSVNDVENLFYRIDMPGHIRHEKGDTFEQLYLSYRGKVPAKAFNEDFAPDKQFLYQRNDKQIPERFIRAYQVKRDGKAGPWLAGMTLDPTQVSEAWCHQRGYVCMIQELHGKQVKAGVPFGAAYLIGWFDDIAEMEKVYDANKGIRSITIQDGKIVKR